MSRDNARIPKLTPAIRRGLREVAALAGADYDADQSEETSRWTKKEAREFTAALEWIDAVTREPL